MQECKQFFAHGYPAPVMHQNAIIARYFRQRWDFFAQKTVKMASEMI
jgi:hypothetical protein